MRLIRVSEVSAMARIDAMPIRTNTATTMIAVVLIWFRPPDRGVDQAGRSPPAGRSLLGHRFSVEPVEHLLLPLLHAAAASWASSWSIPSRCSTPWTMSSAISSS